MALSAGHDVRNDRIGGSLGNLVRGSAISVSDQHGFSAMPSPEEYRSQVEHFADLLASPDPAVVARCNAAALQYLASPAELEMRKDEVSIATASPGRQSGELEVDGN